MGKFNGEFPVLIAVAGTHSDALAALGAAAGKYRCSGLGFIRVKKPCVFARWRRFGWNVRLGITLRS